MSCYSVLTLSEDNQVIDYVEVGVGPYVAAGTAREWMEHNNATTVSNQIEDDDEICGWTEIEPKFESQRQAFQRGRDGLVVSIEREGMSCFNVVTLPENFDQDNQVIDCIQLGAELEDAVETPREWMEHNNL